MEKIRIYGRAEFKGCVEAEALVSPKALEGFSNVNNKRGYTTERDHPLYKVPYTDKVLVFPMARGSGGFVAYARGAKPAALSAPAIKSFQVSTPSFCGALGMPRPFVSA